MKKVIINENQRGFLFKNGKYIKTLGAGKYLVHGGKEIEISDIGYSISCNHCHCQNDSDGYLFDAHNR